jgi:copper(I)-binding protein
MKGKPMFHLRIRTCHYGLLIAAALLWASAALAEESFPQASHLWLRAAPPGAQMLAAYGTLTNNTGKPQTLTGAYAPDFGMAEIHKTVIVDGVARMRHQPAITLQPGETLELKPGSYHIMLMQPAKNFTVGEKAKICLIYTDEKDAQGEKKERVQHLWFPVKKQ